MQTHFKHQLEQQEKENEMLVQDKDQIIIECRQQVETVSVKAQERIEQVEHSREEAVRELREEITNVTQRADAAIREKVSVLSGQSPSSSGTNGGLFSTLQNKVPARDTPQDTPPHISFDRPYVAAPSNGVSFRQTASFTRQTPEGVRVPYAIPLPRQMVFDGKGSWEGFICPFKSVAENCGWDEDEKLFRL